MNANFTPVISSIYDKRQENAHSYSKPLSEENFENTVILSRPWHNNPRNIILKSTISSHIQWVLAVQSYTKACKYITPIKTDRRTTTLGTTVMTTSKQKFTTQNILTLAQELTPLNACPGRRLLPTKKPLLIFRLPSSLKTWDLVHPGSTPSIYLSCIHKHTIHTLSIEFSIR